MHDEEEAALPDECTGDGAVLAAVVGELKLTGRVRDVLVACLVFDAVLVFVEVVCAVVAGAGTVVVVL